MEMESIFFTFSQATQSPSISGSTQMLWKAPHLQLNLPTEDFASPTSSNLATLPLENDFKSFRFRYSITKNFQLFIWFLFLWNLFQATQNPFKYLCIQMALKAVRLLLKPTIEDFASIMFNNHATHLLDRMRIIRILYFFDF